MVAFAIATSIILGALGTLRYVSAKAYYIKKKADYLFKHK